MARKHVVIYHRGIAKVGGIESVIYNLAKIMPRIAYKITVVYEIASWQTALKYSDVADVVKLEKDTKIECDTLIIGSNHIKPENITAKRYIQWIHADYKKYSIPQLYNRDIVDEYVAVSKHVADVAKELYGVEPKVIYNLIDPDLVKNVKNNKYLRLVTNSRVSGEKGFERMLVLCKQLTQAGIPFVWNVYGDCPNKTQYENFKNSFNGYPVTFHGYRQDVSYGLQNADYLVQLSDFEGCPLSVLEALQCGVPVISTEYPSAFELIENGKNGYILPFDMVDVPIEKIVKSIPKEFNTKPLASNKEWQNIL